MNELVRNHSGFRYAEKPRFFRWDSGKYKIKQIIAEYKTECGYAFIVTTDSNHIFELEYDESMDSWQVKPN